MLGNLYENIGAKIKNLAKWIFGFEAIGAIVTGTVLLFADEYLILYGFLTLICGPIIAWVGSWFLYAFGELVEDIHAMRVKYYPIAEEKADCEAKKKAPRETEERARQESERSRQETEKIKQEIQATKLATETQEESDEQQYHILKTIEIVPMNQPENFRGDNVWKKAISGLSTIEIIERYNNKEEWNETYRYLCYLELKVRKDSLSV